MKKKSIAIYAVVASSFLLSHSVTATNVSYNSGAFSFNYDDDLFYYSESTLDNSNKSITISANNMPDDGGGHNTVLICLSYKNDSYDSSQVLSDSDLLDSMKNFASTTCKGFFEIDPGVTITQDSFNNTDEFCEYTMSLSDGTECYTKVFDYGADIHYAICRLCPYSSDLNEDFYQIYNSISIPPSDNNSEQLAADTVKEQNYWKEKYDNLQKEHGELVSEHNQLKNDYDELQRKYDKLLEQSNDSAQNSSDSVAESEGAFSIPEGPSQDNGSTMIDSFRGYAWGASMDEVKSKEITDNMILGDDYAFIEKNNALVLLNQSVSSYSSNIYYLFDENDKLVRGFYYLTEEHTNLTDYYDDYCNIVKLYKDKYGDPVNEKSNWKDETLYKDTPSKWGMAIATGDVTFGADWQDSAGSQIIITLSGDNYRIQTYINYESPNYTITPNTDGI